jgi:hypothetical protein
VANYIHQTQTVNKAKQQLKMDSKQRVTLDNSGLRIRPRSYADTHVPKRVQPQIVNDVRAIPSKVASKPAVLKPEINKMRPAISTQDIAITARTIVDEERSEPIPQPSPNEAVQSKPTLADLVESIQQNISLPEPSFYDSQTSDREVLRAPTKLGSKKQLSNLFSTMRYGWTQKSMLVSAAAVLVIIAGIVVIFSSSHSSRIVTMQVQAMSEPNGEVTTKATSQADELSQLSEDRIPQAVVDSYSVSPDIPKYISIPKISIDKTRILRMGMDENGLIKTPRNMWDTGWYEGSAKPGDTTGAMLIVGHVSGPTEGGVFYNLYRLSIDDQITITGGDGRLSNYKVVSKEEVSDGMNINNYLISKKTDKPGLTLMTSSGELNPKTKEYDRRIAVFAIRTN